MVQLNAASRELTLKIVYYGPGLSGKTTNLQQIHARLPQDIRGRLLSVETHDDRTLFFDMLPVFFESQSGLKVKIKLFTVPGQVIHQATRKLVLQNADGVAFIASGESNAAPENNVYWSYLQQNLKDNNLDPAHVPVVIQFNKMDMPTAKTAQEIEDVRHRGAEPVFTAVAVRGEGVLETLHGLLRETYRSLDKRVELANKFALTESMFLDGVFQNLNVEGTKLMRASPPAGVS
jgi:signal recognition particle receptor subunit beta